VQKVAAPKLEAVPVSRAFVASMLRRAGGADEETVNALVHKQVEEARQHDRKHIDREIESRTRTHEELLKQIKDFEDESGLSISKRWTDGKELGKAVKMVLASGITKTYGGIHGIRNTVLSTLKELDKALADFGAASGDENA
jgi:hypothetical protein